MKETATDPHPTASHAAARTPAVAGRVLGTEEAGPDAGAFGFAAARAVPARDAFVHAPQEAHGLVLASTGAGKFVNVVAPAVLGHPGPVIQVDTKGEITQVTRRQRARTGRYVTLDPFDTLGENSSDALNPLDLLRLPGLGPAAEARMIADDLGRGRRGSRDPFWGNAAAALVEGLIGHAGGHADPAGRTLVAVAELLYAHDLADRIACDIEMDQVTEPAARRALRGFLETPEGNGSHVRSNVLAFARGFLGFLSGPSVERSLGPTSFPLASLAEGREPLTISLVFPEAKAASHRGLLRLWISLLLRVLESRRRIPAVPTLLVIDEAANLGRLDLLPRMHSFARGKGVSLLTLWQSLSQLTATYPDDHRTILENCGVTQAFGLHPTAVGPVAELYGVAPALLRGLGGDEQLVLTGRGEPRVLRKIDYRTHPPFRGMAIDPNPAYEPGPTRGAPAASPGPSAG